MAQTICPACSISIDSRGLGSHQNSDPCSTRSETARMRAEGRAEVLGPCADRIRAAHGNNAIVRARTHYRAGSRDKRAVVEFRDWASREHAAEFQFAPSTVRAAERAAKKAARRVEAEPLENMLISLASIGFYATWLDRTISAGRIDLLQKLRTSECKFLFKFDRVKTSKARSRHTRARAVVRNKRGVFDRTN